MNFQETVVYALVALLVIILVRNVVITARYERLLRKRAAGGAGDELRDERDEDRKAMILDRAEEMGKITNDAVQAMFHVSHTTAWRYLEELEREGRLAQRGVAGQAVYYELI